MLFNYVPLRIRSALSLFNVYGDSTLLVLNGTASGQLPTRKLSHRTGIGPDEWIYWFAVVLVGSYTYGELSRDSGPCGQHLGFIFIRWGIVPSGELS